MKWPKTSLYLRNKRQENCLSQNELQKELGMTNNNSFVSRVERGLIMFSHVQLKKLIKIIKLDKDQLVNFYSEDVCQSEKNKLLRSITQK